MLAGSIRDDCLADSREESSGHRAVLLVPRAR
jgi:hypothetical protein